MTWLYVLFAFVAGRIAGMLLVLGGVTLVRVF
jgi:hypothetical protein